MEAIDKKNLAIAILEKVGNSAGPKKPNKASTDPAARAMIEALKDGDAEKLTQSLSDFIRIHANT
jgi:hypothetical protein